MRKRNFWLFLTSTSVFDFALGFFGPFWFLFVSDFGGGVQQFGYAISLMMAASAVTSFFAGKQSDTIGRKPFLILSGAGLALVIFSYTLVETVLALFVLQVLYGIFLAIQGTAESALIGDLTHKAGRGVDVGTLHFSTQLSAAAAILVAGIVGSKFGTEVIFYIASGFMLLSVSVIAFLSEDKEVERESEKVEG